jgi:nucleoid DNA-binding protein
MYSLPEDLELEIQKKYQNVHVRELVDHIFRLILNKTLNHGSCQIREFGRFISYKTKSTKTSTYVIRFKFRTSTTLDKKIKNDQYYLKNIPVKANVPFGIENEKKCENKKSITYANLQAEREAEREARNQTKKHIVIHEIDSILESNGKK